MSSNHFENIDLVGQDFMAAVCGFVSLDYPGKEIIINEK
jgi:hypothetical protein